MVITRRPSSGCATFSRSRERRNLKIRSKKYLVQSRSFAEMLEATIRRYQNRTIEAAQVIAELMDLAVRQIVSRAKCPNGKSQINA
jgi:Domain of unknown function (DUF3387)